MSGLRLAGDDLAFDEQLDRLKRAMLLTIEGNRRIPPAVRDKACRIINSACAAVQEQAHVGAMLDQAEIEAKRAGWPQKGIKDAA